MSYIKNLCERPMHKLEDRKTMVESIYKALLDSKDAVLDFKGEMHRYTPDELANWQSRQFFADVLLTFPVSQPQIPAGSVRTETTV